jgi:hypothetical protein
MFFPISYKNSTNCLSDQDFYQQEQNQQSFSGFHTLHFNFFGVQTCHTFSPSSSEESSLL